MIKGLLFFFIILSCQSKATINKIQEIRESQKINKKRVLIIEHNGFNPELEIFKGKFKGLFKLYCDYEDYDHIYTKSCEIKPLTQPSPTSSDDSYPDHGTWVSSIIAMNNPYVELYFLEWDTGKETAKEDKKCQDRPDRFIAHRQKAIYNFAKEHGIHFINESSSPILGGTEELRNYGLMSEAELTPTQRNLAYVWQSYLWHKYYYYSQFREIYKVQDEPPYHFLAAGNFEKVPLNAELGSLLFGMNKSFHPYALLKEAAPKNYFIVGAFDRSNDTTWGVTGDLVDFYTQGTQIPMMSRDGSKKIYVGTSFSTPLTIRYFTFLPLMNYKEMKQHIESLKTEKGFFPEPNTKDIN